MVTLQLIMTSCTHFLEANKRLEGSDRPRSCREIVIAIVSWEKKTRVKMQKGFFFFYRLHNFIGIGKPTHALKRMHVLKTCQIFSTIFQLPSHVKKWTWKTLYAFAGFSSQSLFPNISCYKTLFMGLCWYFCFMNCSSFLQFKLIFLCYENYPILLYWLFNKKME